MRLVTLKSPCLKTGLTQLQYKAHPIAAIYIYICNFLNTIRAKFLNWHDEKIYNLDKHIISDISLSTFTIHLRAIINKYGTVDIIKQTFSTLITKAFNDLQTFESNKQLVFDLLDINITSIKSWFAIIIEHGTIVQTNNVVLIGSKLNPVLYAFGVVDSAELKQKIRFFVEVLGEVFMKYQVDLCLSNVK